MLPQELRIEQLRKIITETNIGKNPAGQRTLPDDLRVKGGLFFGGKKNFTEMPDNLTIVGDLLLRGTGLTYLPEKLRVYGSLSIADTRITVLPTSLKVYGNLDIRKTKIKDVPPCACLGSVIRTDQDSENATTALNIDGFLEITGLPEMPRELQQLIAFQDKNGFESFCHGFCIYAQENSVFRAWTKSEALIERLYCIGQASGSGALYAIWNVESAKPLNEQPVVAFGDEGGAWVVAANLEEFLRLLSFDAEPRFSNEGIAFEKEQAASEHHRSFTAFLRKQGFSAIAKADELQLMVRKTQAAYQQRFNESALA